MTLQVAPGRALYALRGGVPTRIDDGAIPSQEPETDELPTTGLLVHLDSRDPLGGQPRPVDGTAVDSWSNLVSGGTAFGPTTAARRPLLATADTIQTVQFDGTDDNVGATPTPLTAGASFSAYVLFKQTGGQGFPRLFGDRDATYNGWAFTPNATNVRVIMGHGGNFVVANGPGGYALNAWHLHEVVYDATTRTATVYRDGVAGTPATLPVAWTASTNGRVHLGGSTESNSHIGGHAAAVLLYSGAHDTVTRRQVEDYIGRRL